MTKVKTKKYTRVDISGDVQEIEKPIESKQKRGLNISKYMDLGLQLSIPLLLAVFAGQYLDRKYGKQSFFTILFIIFGTITVFYNLYKLSKEDVSRNHTGK